jgi:hypothetical protein
VKTIGIVGGVAWPSSIAYYPIINELVAQRMGGLHCTDLVLAQTDFEQIERYQREGRWDLAGGLLAAQGNRLKAAGADLFLLVWPEPRARHGLRGEVACAGGELAVADRLGAVTGTPRQRE